MENEKALALRPDWAISNFDGLLKLSSELIKTGFLPSGIKTPQQAVAIILTGRELGIPTMQALRQINVIQGKPTVPPELMLALAYQRIPGFSATVLESTTTICRMRFKRGEAVFDSSFSMEDAKRMGLAGKDNWLKQPATMLRWRCIAQGLRLIAPDATGGIYTTEEMNPDLPVDEDRPRMPPLPVAPEAPPIRIVSSEPIPEPDDVPYYEPPPPRPQEDVVSPSHPLVLEDDPQIVKDAAEIFNPTEIKRVGRPPKSDKPKEKKPPATLRIGADQIDVMGGYMIRDQLKGLGFRWNQEINAWSAPFDEERLAQVNELIGVQ